MEASPKVKRKNRSYVIGITFLKKQVKVPFLQLLTSTSTSYFEIFDFLTSKAKVTYFYSYLFFE